MGRILAIDYGTKRTGIAVSDPLQIIAGGLETVPTNTLMQWLKSYIGQEKVDTIVVGKPTQMNGRPSESMAYIEPFVGSLKKEFPEIAVEWYDERFTSRMAQRTIIEAGISKMKRRDKALVDRVSATIILQSYMESQLNRL